MKPPFTALRLGMAFGALTAMVAPAFAQEVNVYSSRHYDTDDALYERFTEETGISVNRIEAQADELIARMLAEGANSPADVLITVDVGRMERAEAEGLLQPYASEVIQKRVPAHLQHPEELWYGVAQRTRIIFYSKDRVENPPQTYEALADPEFEGRICIRSSSNVYNQSLLASLIEVHGEETAREWATGIVNNMARPPQGGDTDQLRGIVSGECDISVANHYYFARGLARHVDGLTGSTDEIGWVWPNQSDRGTHVNLTTAGMAANAPNSENALALLEFLTGAYAQGHFASQNHEFPVIDGVETTDAANSLGTFKPDTTTPTASFVANAPRAQAIFNEVGWD
jgi:iron(III) transport system substrate-binding protein